MRHQDHQLLSKLMIGAGESDSDDNYVHMTLEGIWWESERDLYRSDDWWKRKKMFWQRDKYTKRSSVGMLEWCKLLHFNSNETHNTHGPNPKPRRIPIFDNLSNGTHTSVQKQEKASRQTLVFTSGHTLLWNEIWIMKQGVSKEKRGNETKQLIGNKDS